MIDDEHVAIMEVKVYKLKELIDAYEDCVYLEDEQEVTIESTDLLARKYVLAEEYFKLFEECEECKCKLVRNGLL